jgi:hypothetical protein
MDLKLGTAAGLNVLQRFKEIILGTPPSAANKRTYLLRHPP